MSVLSLARVDGAQFEANGHDVIGRPHVNGRPHSVDADAEALHAADRRVAERAAAHRLQLKDVLLPGDFLPLPDHLNEDENDLALQRAEHALAEFELCPDPQRHVNSIVRVREVEQRKLPQAAEMRRRHEDATTVYWRTAKRISQANGAE